MKALHLTLLLLTLAACSGPQYLYKGERDGVELAYRWNHPKDKPSELLLHMKNMTPGDKRIALAIDLFYQGRTVETLEADTCIRTGQTLNGKLNGIYFIPERITTEQIKNGGVQVEMTKTRIEAEPCQ